MPAELGDGPTRSYSENQVGQPVAWLLCVRGQLVLKRSHLAGMLHLEYSGATLARRPV
jgi:hypothetical protein